MAVVTHGVSSTTHEKLLIDAGAVYLGFLSADNPGTLLGATKGGNTYEINTTILDVRPDGSIGPIKGFRRIGEVVVKLTVNLLEITAENLRRALGIDSYSSGTTLVSDEAVGDGDGITKEFALDHGNVLENSEIITIEGAAQVRGTDYTMDYDTGTIQFVVAPGSGASYSIVATYTYISGDALIAGEEVTDSCYVDSVALLGTLAGFTNPVICKLTNALCDAGLSIKLAPKEEAVPQIVFTGHYLSSDLSARPFSIEYPVS